ncbi:hypothetical protein [Paracoccus contaminans]|uniref:hypothetical protein n=1 Tax=Paracoccus contaminans TaxID=1945662 RepID=UPI00198159B1|nr:hypothetical protein [Paracoccus contaminans]
MIDFSAAERRLIAALERLDHCVALAAQRPAAQGPQADAGQPAASLPPAPPSAEIAALHDRQAATLEAMAMRLAEANERLAAAGEAGARLAAANDDLARANRDLIAQLRGDGADAQTAVRAALDAEIEALRAARAAELAQMGEILDALDRMLGVTTTPRSHSTAGRAATRRPLPATAPADTAPAPQRPSALPPRERTVIRNEDVPGDEHGSLASAPMPPEDEGAVPPAGREGDGGDDRPVHAAAPGPEPRDEERR